MWLQITRKQHLIWELDHRRLWRHTVRFTALKSCLLCCNLKADLLTYSLRNSDRRYFSAPLEPMWQSALKNKNLVGLLSQATSQLWGYCKRLPLMQVIWLWTSEKKKKEERIQSSFIRKEPPVIKIPTRFPFKWPNLGFNLPTLSSGPSFWDETSQRLLCAALCDLNFDTESKWLRHMKTKGGYPDGLDSKM